MPNGDDRAKKAAEMSKERGRIAATITDPDERRNYVARQGWLESFSSDLGATRRGYTPGVERALQRENQARTSRRK